jgi:hypothetical protein
MTRARTPLTVEQVQAILTVAAGPHAPRDTYAAVEAAAGRALGHRLFTLMILHDETGEVERVYSSRPHVYPVGGRKAKRGTPWGGIVIDRGEVYVGRSADDIRWAFDDHPLILGLGLQSVLNVPVSFQGRRLGTMNLLHEAGWYDDADGTPGRLLAGLLVPDLLAQRAAGPAGAR